MSNAISKKELDCYRDFIESLGDKDRSYLVRDLFLNQGEVRKFSSREIKTFWEERDERKPVNFYLHIPFCREKCYSSYKASSSKNKLKIIHKLGFNHISF